MRATRLLLPAAAYLALAAALCVPRAAEATVLFDAATTLTTSYFEPVLIGSVNPDPFTVKTGPLVFLSDFGTPFGTGVYHRATLEVDGGRVFNPVLHDSGTLQVNEGQVITIEAQDGSRVGIGGTTNSVQVSYVNAVDAAQIDIRSGQVGQIVAYNNAAVDISGGIVGIPETGLGGNFYSVIGAFDQSTIDFHGYGFALGTPRPDFYAGYQGIWRQVTGTLSDGTALNAQLFVASSGPRPTDPEVNFLRGATVPEAGTLLYLIIAAGAIGVASPRRRPVA